MFQVCKAWVAQLVGNNSMVTQIIIMATNVSFFGRNYLDIKFVGGQE
jgi:hypothetical protein